jgi:hypothetical protein
VQELQEEGRDFFPGFIIHTNKTTIGNLVYHNLLETSKSAIELPAFLSPYIQNTEKSGNIK